MEKDILQKMKFFLYPAFLGKGLDTVGGKYETSRRYFRAAIGNEMAVPFSAGAGSEKNPVAGEG